MALLCRVVSSVLLAATVRSMQVTTDDQAWLDHTGDAMAASEDEMWKLLGDSAGSSLPDNEPSLTEEEEFIYKPELPVAPGTDATTPSSLNSVLYVPKMVD